jgi:integrase
MLLLEQNPRVIENHIIGYVRSLREKNLAYASIVFNVSPIITFYELNNITLNRKKISRYYGEHIRVVKDRGYSTEEIATILQTADIRMRMIILLLSSTGCRVGALPSVNLSNLTFKPEYGLYKITFYESSNSEYYTFTTHECASAINNYLTFRSRQGERLSFDQNLNRWMLMIPHLSD